MNSEIRTEQADFSTRDRRRSLIAVISSLTVTSLIYGLSFPLLALILEQQGVDETLIGLNTGVQGLAVFAVAPFAPRLLRRVSPSRLMLTSVVLSLVLFLLLPVFPNVYMWFPIRFLLGCANAFLWIVGEAWVNELAAEKSRGRIVGLYSSALAAGFALGPVLLAETGTIGWTPFLVSAALIALSAAPLFLARSVKPKASDKSSVRLFAFLLLAPVAMLANFMCAAVDTALITFLPIYGISMGLEESIALYMVTAMGLGGIMSQVPIGWLADHMDRRLLLTLTVVVLILICALIPFNITSAPWNWSLMFIMGGAIGGLYTIGLVLVGEQFSGAELASAVTVFSSMWGIGSIAGTPFVGGVMEAIPTYGLAVALGAMLLAYLPFPALAFFRGKAANGN